MSDSPLSIPCTIIKGGQRALADLGGKALLVANTTNKCGFTPQYQELEVLWEKYRERGLVVLGFPYNQFSKQESGDEGEVSQFCELNYGVSFPLFRKIRVSGADAHPLFVSLKKRTPGPLGSQGIKWNLTKFLIGRDGQVAKRYAPTTKPKESGSATKALLE